MLTLRGQKSYLQNIICRSFPRILLLGHLLDYQGITSLWHDQHRQRNHRKFSSNGMTSLGIIHWWSHNLNPFYFQVHTYGLVPNGGRIYYTKRSQPPYLTLMMKEYMDKTADIHFLRSQLPTLVRELEFWETNRSVLLEKNGTTYQLFAFATGGTGKGKFLMQKIQG